MEKEDRFVRHKIASILSELAEQFRKKKKQLHELIYVLLFTDEIGREYNISPVYEHYLQAGRSNQIGVPMLREMFILQVIKAFTELLDRESKKFLWSAGINAGFLQKLLQRHLKGMRELEYEKETEEEWIPPSKHKEEEEDIVFFPKKRTIEEDSEEDLQRSQKRLIKEDEELEGGYRKRRCRKHQFE